LYADEYKSHQNLLGKLAKNSHDSGEAVFCVSDKKTNNSDDFIADFDVDIEHKIIKFIDSIKLKKQFGRIIIEAPQNSFDGLDSLIELLHNKLLESMHGKWTRRDYKFKTTDFKNFFDFFMLIPISSVNADRMQYLVNKFSKTVVLGDNTIFFWNGKAEARTISKNIKEEFVKNNLNHIIPMLLFEKPSCGYDLIKKIFENYAVSVPQSTVYTILYSLQKKGIINVKKLDDNKTKVFYLADAEEAKNELVSFTDFIKLFLNLNPICNLKD